MPSLYVEAKNVKEWMRFFQLGKILDLQFLVCEPEHKYWDLLGCFGGANNFKSTNSNYI